MLNLWVCSSETENETSDPSYPGPSDQWNPVQAHQTFHDEHEAPDRRLVPRRLSSVLHSSEVGTDLSDVKITEVPVVSSYGSSVADTKSKASGRNSLCRGSSSSREFYTRAQQQQILLKAQYDLTRSQTTNYEQDQYKGNPNSNVSVSVHENQSLCQGQSQGDNYQPLYNHYDNRTHRQTRRQPIRRRGHYAVQYGNNGHYGAPEPFSQASNCDAHINNSTHLHQNYQVQAPSSGPAATCSQYSYSEYTTSHHPSQCNDSTSAYEYNNYSHPQVKPGSYYGSQFGSHSNNSVAMEPQWQASPQDLAPVTQTQQDVPECDLDLDLIEDFCPPIEAFLGEHEHDQDCLSISVSDIDPIDVDFGEKPLAALAPLPGVGAEDATPDMANQFDAMYRNLCLFYKTYGHTNVPKINSWFLLGSWVDSLRKRKKFQILAERGIKVASHVGPPLTHEEIGLLDNIGFEWTATTTAKETEAIVASMNNVDKAIAEQAATSTSTSLEPTPSTDNVEGTNVSSEDNSVLPEVNVDLQVTLGSDTNKGLEATSDILQALPAVSIPSHSGAIIPSPYPEQQAVVGVNPPISIPSNHGAIIPSPYPEPQISADPMGIKLEILPIYKLMREKEKRLFLSTTSTAERKESKKDSNNNFGNMSEQLWYAQFKRLVEFHRIHGITTVPARYSPDPKLGHWVMTQRRQYQLLQSGKPSRMNQERIDLLEALSFQWSIRKDPELMWQTRYQELVKYKKEHGNCLVPQRYSGNPQLGTWVNTQRRHFKLLKAGKKSCMTSVRRKALDDIGFFWSSTT